MKKFYQKCKVLVVAAAVVIGSAVASVVTPIVSYAADVDLATLYAAIDLTGMKTNILALLLVGIGIVMLFVGYKLFRKGVNKVA